MQNVVTRDNITINDIAVLHTAIYLTQASAQGRCHVWYAEHCKIQYLVVHIVKGVSRCGWLSIFLNTNLTNFSNRLCYTCFIFVLFVSFVFLFVFSVVLLFQLWMISLLTFSILFLLLFFRFYCYFWRCFLPNILFCVYYFLYLLHCLSVYNIDCEPLQDPLLRMQRYIIKQKHKIFLSFFIIFSTFRPLWQAALPTGETPF